MAFEALKALLGEPVYGLAEQEKTPKLLAALREVSGHHYANCAPYQRLCDKRGVKPADLSDVAELPYLPTSLFKDTLLLSVPEDDVFREIRSSATSSGRPSRLGLDKATNRRQTKCFGKVALNRLGNSRYDFVVLDEPSVLERSAVVSARGSTIRSLLFCSKSATTCLTESEGKLSLDRPALEALLAGRESNDDLVIFGFTYVLYAHVVRPLLEAGVRFDLSGAKVVHIGGWKKLEAEKVSSEDLIKHCGEAFGVSPGDVIDIYGFTEQGGMVYPTCPEGRRHAPTWGEVIARDPLSLEPVARGSEGLMQFITPIQTSYPGHSVLTEDVGQILGRDDCPCGRMGTTFKVTGRALNAEVRGCGDIMADKFR